MTEVVAGRDAPVRARFDRIWLALPYALVVAAAAITWVQGGLPADRRPVLLLGSLVVVAWHTWFAVLHPRWLEARLGPMLVYFVGMVGLTAYLFSLTFSFFPLYLVCFPLAFVALPGRWAYAGVALATAVALFGPRLLTWSGENVVVMLAGGLLAAVAGGSIRALEAETARRRAALQRLADAHEALERALADKLALQDRLLIEARAAGVAAERTRLAGEIHDTLAAGLAGVVSQLEALDAQLEPQHPLRHRVATSTEVARASLTEARRSVRALRPGLLATGSLPVALDEVARGVERLYRVPVRFHQAGPPPSLPAAAEDVLLRAAQEGLTNAARHAGATTLHLTLTSEPGFTALDVADDGTGFDPGSAAPGHGLAIMADRVHAVGGRLSVASTPGRGTVLTVTLDADR